MVDCNLSGKPRGSGAAGGCGTLQKGEEPRGEMEGGREVGKVEGGRGAGGNVWEHLRSEVHGQWRVSNGSCGTLRQVKLRYNASGTQSIFRVNAGPWLMLQSDVRGSNVVCIEVP
jgi:hypothetical protein